MPFSEENDSDAESVSLITGLQLLSTYKSFRSSEQLLRSVAPTGQYSSTNYLEKSSNNDLSETFAGTH